MAGWVESGEQGLGSEQGTALTLVAEDSAAADAAALTLGKGQEAAHLAREHGLAPRVVPPCR